MARNRGHHQLEPLRFSGTSHAARLKFGITRPFRLAEQVRRRVRLRAFWRNKATDVILAQRYGNKGDFAPEAALLRWFRGVMPFLAKTATKHPKKINVGPMACAHPQNNRLRSARGSLSHSNPKRTTPVRLSLAHPP